MIHSMRRSSSRFSLVEMLLILAIIAILASLLLPTLHKAQETARSTYCIHNLHQIGIMADNYASDYYNYYPPLYYTIGVYGPYLQPTLRAHAGQDAGKALVSCPSRDPKYANEWTHYAASFGGGPGTHPVFTPAKVQGVSEHLRKRPEIRAPGTTMSFCEGTTISSFGAPTFYVRCLVCKPNDNVQLHFQHVNRTNILFFDGHAMSVGGEFVFANQGDFWTHVSRLPQ